MQRAEDSTPQEQTVDKLPVIHRLICFLQKTDQHSYKITQINVLLTNITRSEHKPKIHLRFKQNYTLKRSYHCFIAFKSSHTREPTFFFMVIAFLRWMAICRIQMKPCMYVACVSREYISVKVRCIKLIMGSALGEVNLQFCTQEMYICCKSKMEHIRNRTSAVLSRSVQRCTVHLSNLQNRAQIRVLLVSADLVESQECKNPIRFLPCAPLL